jgi:hypothetical protein
LRLFRKVCFVLFILGLALSVMLAFMGELKAVFWILLVSALIQLVGRLR